jgi:hypothetical protein
VYFFKIKNKKLMQLYAVSRSGLRTIPCTRKQKGQSKTEKQHTQFDMMNEFDAMLVNGGHVDVFLFLFYLKFSLKKATASFVIFFFLFFFLFLSKFVVSSSSQVRNELIPNLL